MEQEEYRLPPRVLLNSLGAILLVYVGVLVSQAVCFYLVSLLFPNLDIFTSPKNAQNGLFRQLASPPPSFFWIALALTSLCCVAIGALVARSAKFSPLGHTVFGAVLIAITYLQTSFSTPSHLKWVALVAMVLFPSGILIGGHLFAPQQMMESDPSSDAGLEEETVE
jgi:hypothetical protein